MTWAERFDWVFIITVSGLLVELLLHAIRVAVKDYRDYCKDRK